MKNTFDIIVIGGGHAGCEAASAAASLGSRTLIITMDMTKFGQMSCNPAVGGIGKGQIVREIDALGGNSAIVTDKSTLQFRMLNTSKGAAVWSPRAQCDRQQFSVEWRSILEKSANLCIWQDEVVKLVVQDGVIKGVETALGARFMCKAAVLTAGTFLNGRLFVGNSQASGGRSGDAASIGISRQLVEYGVEVGRMKTGTSMRVDGRSVDFGELVVQNGDEMPFKFSFSAETTAVKRQIPCYIAQTNEEAHAILRDAFKESPLFSGEIKGIGPRYCPSIEDKLRTFADRTSHHLFIEPEGRATCECYINGFSSSLPYAAQIAALHKIKGFEKAVVFRPGYAVEYDYFPPTQLQRTLESKAIGGLYFAGQVNGTTGYEEAAGQGLWAGINAHLKISGGEEFVLERHEAYLGVLIDDLVTKGVDEPYRMFTSRAEHRILLRQDNADLRLAKVAEKYGLLTESRAALVRKRQETLENMLDFLRNNNVSPDEINGVLEESGATTITHPQSMWDILQRPMVSLSVLLGVVGGKYRLPDVDRDMAVSVEAAVKYCGYEERERQVCEKLERLGGVRIPTGFDYARLGALSIEAQEKLSRVQPATLAQAARIPGVSPADIAAVVVGLGR